MMIDIEGVAKEVTQHVTFDGKRVHRFILEYVTPTGAAKALHVIFASDVNDRVIIFDGDRLHIHGCVINLFNMMANDTEDVPTFSAAKIISLTRHSTWCRPLLPGELPPEEVEEFKA